MTRHRLTLPSLVAFVGCFVLPVLGGAVVCGLAVIAVLLLLYR